MFFVLLRINSNPSMFNMKRLSLSGMWLTALLTLTLFPANAQADSHRVPLQVRFNQPGSFEGALPWYHGKPQGFKGKLPISYIPAAQIDPEWENNSLPIGNSNIGASVFGCIETERISLNEKSLWLGGPNTSKGTDYYWKVNKQSAGVLKDIREAFAKGDKRKAAELTMNNMNGYISYEAQDEDPFRFGAFTTLGELHIESGLKAENAIGYEKVLSLDSAMTRIAFTDRTTGVRYLRESFCSFPENVLVMRYSANRKGMQNLKLTYHDNPLATGQCVPWGRDGLKYTGRLDNNQMEFCLLIRAQVTGGSVSNADGTLTIRGAKEVTFLLTADTDYRMNFNPDYNDPLTYVGEKPQETTAAWMEAAAKMNYKKLLKRHLADYQPLFRHVDFCLGNRGVDLSKATSQRLADYRRNGNDPYLETLYFQFGRYLLIASSRAGSLPANLQGIWLNNIDGPWHCDYHNNINIQMNYWPALCDNLLECMQPMIDYIKTQVKPGEETARSYWGARGWTASISANPFGFTAPLRDRAMSYNLSPAAGPWLATHLWDYYDYTRDREWLRSEGYPIIRGAARFATDFLWKKPDGTYTAAPSTSPEHGGIDEGVTYVHAVVRELLSDAIQAANILQVDADEAREWQNVIDRLVPYQIGRYGQLQEWSTDIDDPKDEHRHVNHLFGLHPGSQISPITTPDLAQASRVVLEHRGDGATGWSMGWKLNQWARLHDGNHAYMLYGNLLKNGTANNLWDMHPPFQIDGNFGGTAGVTEMLFQCHAGFLHFLPALPDAWSEGHINGLLARGGFEVDIEWSNGSLTRAIVRSKKGEKCSVRYRQATLEFATQAGKQYQLEWKDGALRLTK